MIKFPDNKKSEPTFTITVDKVALMSSRPEASRVLVHAIREICEKTNIVMPQEYMLIPEIYGDPADPQLKVGFFMSLKVNPIHELIYFALIKIPFFGRYVRGPKVVSYLMPSEADIKKLEKKDETNHCD
jgi:hypothetical protein